MTHSVKLSARMYQLYSLKTLYRFNHDGLTYRLNKAVT